ncbi:hypothetical protein [Flavobacterium sp. I3-2]|uniref:hypothetical protein n=1 Tax=Flavobacterium sp. I3-2 TaxID=2748319 RepID=UPI0015B1FE57|nr:hypothetical protein [Flavobacterium sp. I3-2]
MNHKRSYRKTKAFLIITISIVTLISLIYLIIYVRYPLQREQVLNHYLFSILFASLCFSVVSIAFANFLINNGEERERQGLSFSKNPIRLKKITLNTFIVLAAITYYFWDNILDFDLLMKEEYSYFYNARYIDSSVSYGKYASNTRWYYTFVNTENDTIVLNSQSENLTASRLELNTDNLKVSYLPNTKRLWNITKD